MRAKTERKMQLIFSGSEWIDVRTSDQGKRYNAKVRRQGYSLAEQRWASTVTPLTEDEKREGLRMIEDLKREVAG